MTYHVYILRCADSTLYTGVAKNLSLRLDQHNTSRLGAKYTRGRRPVTLLYSEQHPDRSSAQIAEARIKKLSHSQKLSYTHQLGNK